MTLFSPSNLTADIYKYSRQLFRYILDKGTGPEAPHPYFEPGSNETLQLSLFDLINREKLLRLDQAIDDIRMKF